MPCRLGSDRSSADLSVRSERSATGAVDVRIVAVLARIAPASALVTFATLPVFLVASLSVVMRPEIVITEARVGTAVAVNYLAAMLWSVPAGRMTQRDGARRGLRAGTALAVLGIGAVIAAAGWTSILLGMVLTGVATAFLQVAANLAIADSVPPARLGLAYSVKQSAIPLATLGAGLAVPIAARVVPWRAVFVLVLLCVVIASVVGSAATRGADAGTAASDGSVPWPALAALTLGVAAASAAATSAAAFLVSFLVTIDVPAGTAGGLLAVSSLLTVVGRVAVGQLRDRRDLDGLRIMLVQVLIGAVALGVLATAATPDAVLLTAVLVAFLAGWTWSGVFTDAVVRSAPSSAARTTGITQIGVYLGGGGGPLAFGLIVAASGYAAAWTTAALSFVASGACIALGRRLVGAGARAHGSTSDRRSQGRTGSARAARWTAARRR